MIEVADVPVPDGQPVRARRGDLVRVRLDEHATTGYRWSVASADEGLQVETNTFLPPDPGAGMGAGGGRIVEVRVAREGDARLVLHLKRSWEAEPLEERVIEIRTEPADAGGAPAAS